MTYRATGTFASGTTTCSPSLPTGTVANDILVMFIETLDSETPTVSGWTQAPNSPQSDTDATAHTKLSIFAKRAVGGDVTATGGTTDHVSAHIEGFSGCRINGGIPWNVTAGSIDTTSDGDATINGATTTKDGCDVLVALGITRNAANTGNFSGWTNADLAGLIETYDRTIATGTGGGVGTAVGSKTTAGAYGTTAVNISSSQRKCMWTGALEPELPPVTVPLNPPDTGTFPSTTPNLDWLGADPNSDDIEYEILIQNLIDSYSETNQDSTVLLSSTKTGGAQCFHGVSKPLKIAKWFLVKTGSPTGNAVAKLYALTGTFGTNGVPTGAALATSDNFDVSTLTTSLQLISFTFSTPFTMSTGTDYALSIEYSGSSGGNSISIGLDLISSTHAGNASTVNSGVWSNQTGDYPFYVYDTLIDKVSSSDAGFQNVTTPADTHPFATSFDTIRYTVQAGDTLRVGDSYSWQVRGIDPSGSNAYGAYSAARTFTVVLLPEFNRPISQAVQRASTR